MIKKQFYNNDLIPIGNDTLYPGKPVWTDGKVAYGWHYTPQAITPAPGKNYAGLWVAETHNTLYKLVQRGLSTGQWLHGNDIQYDNYCLPCKFDTVLRKKMYTPGGDYTFEGDVVAVDNTGKILTWDRQYLRFYNADGTVTALSFTSDGLFDRFKGNYTKVSNLYSTTDAPGGNSPRLFQLATPDQARVFGAVASVVIDSTFVANTDNLTEITLNSVTSCILTSDTLQFQTSPGVWGNSITVTTSGNIVVRAGAVGSGTVRAQYTYLGSTITGDIPVVIDTVAQVSERGLYTLSEFVIDRNGARADVYPRYWDLCTGARLRLFDGNGVPEMALLLTVDEQEEEILNDPLGILSGHGITFPAGVYAYRRDNSRVYIAHYARLWLYTGVTGAYTDKYTDLNTCWSLAWINSKL